MDQKIRFIADYQRRFSSLSELCARSDISRETAYKWIERYEADGPSGLQNRSWRRRCSTFDATTPPGERRSSCASSPRDTRRRNGLRSARAALSSNGTAWCSARSVGVTCEPSWRQVTRSSRVSLGRTFFTVGDSTRSLRIAFSSQFAYIDRPQSPARRRTN